MINNLQNFCRINIIYSLALFIMIHQNQLFLFHAQQISSGHCSDIFSMFVHHRKGSVACFYHDIFYIICEIISLEGNQVILFHNMFYRNTLIDQPGNGKRIQRGTDDHALIPVCRFHNIVRHLRIVTKKDTADVSFNGT